MRKLYSFIFTSIAWIISIKIVGFIKLSCMVGSSTVLFSATSIIRPLVGYFSSVASIGPVFIIPSLMHCFGWQGFHVLAYHVPGMFAALYWRIQTGFFRVGVPLLCMGLFIIHPIGKHVACYSLYWLIPIMYYFCKKNNLFLDALSSTLLAHAVGSIIWLYTVPSSVQQWQALIPMVFIERLVFASGMVLVCTLISGVTSVAKKCYSLMYSARFLKYLRG